MTPRLTALVALDAAVLALWALWSAAWGRPLTAVLIASLALLELLLLGQAVADGVRIVAGHRPVSTATHVGYLLASLWTLPLSTGPAVARSVRGEQCEPRGDSLMVAFGCVITLVLVVRLAMTWPSAHG